MGKKTAICSRGGCYKPAVNGGLCEKHSAEEERKQQEENEAVRLLHDGTTYELKPIQDPELQQEFVRLRSYWHKACDSVNFHIPDPVLRDEAEFAVDWCIALTKALIRADRLIAEGKRPLPELDLTRQWVWDRFKNLEAGLRSNGTPRPENG